MAGMAECQVVELKNGTILVNSRNEIRGTTHPKTRAAAISNDGGATFQPFYYVDELEEPTCSAGMINVGGAFHRRCVDRLFVFLDGLSGLLVRKIATVG